MQTYIAILRGINVSGSKLIKMEELRNVLTSSGFRNVQTYIQSGNVIFREEKTNASELEKRIAEIISDRFNFYVPVIVVEITELKSILDHNPFLNDKSREAEYLHITFLSEVPGYEKAEGINKIMVQNDEFKIFGKAVYLYCPGGYGKTKLNNSFFENKLKVTATTRNWKTSNELLKISEKLTSSFLD
jgi:uncharacterized protein (DUF1697 family)